MEGEDYFDASAGVSSPNTIASRPIPIQRNRPGGVNSPSTTTTGSGNNFAQSAPAPRAPTIGSLKPPSFLGSRMPHLELPPQSPGASSTISQSAPVNQYLLSSKKPILHSLQIRERSDSTASSGKRSFRKRGQSSGLRNRRVSWDDEVQHGVLFEQAEEDEDEEVDEQVDTNGDELEMTAAQLTEEEPHKMEVFSAIRSLSASAKEYSFLETEMEKMRVESSKGEQQKREMPSFHLEASTDIASTNADSNKLGGEDDEEEDGMMFKQDVEDAEAIEQDDIVQFDMDGA